MAHRTLVLLFLLTCSAAAQFDIGMPTLNHRVRVHLSFAGGGDCDASTKVDLMKSASAAVARGSTDKACVVEFFGVPAGTYFLSISGHGFSNVETSELVLTSPDTESVDITVRPPESKSSDDSELRSSWASVADMRVPKKAAKEFNRANQEMEQQNWNEAISTLQKAIAIYPRYAAAYNNLGVIFARMGDRKREAEALQQALSIDDRYVPAHLNMARMDIAANAFPQAEIELKMASALDPGDGVTLVLLSYAEYMNHDLDDAIANCRKVHAMPDFPHAGAHWVAAFAYEHKNQITDAATEFQAYVREQPTGVRADAARKELANIADFLAGK